MPKTPIIYGGGWFICSTSNGNEKTSTEVKIKITKKQLEELIGNMEVKELGIEHILSHLVKHSHQYHSFHRPWRPALYSIPEI